jgi:hypothetical protein
VNGPNKIAMVLRLNRDNLKGFIHTRLGFASGSGDAAFRRPVMPMADFDLFTPDSFQLDSFQLILPESSTTCHDQPQDQTSRHTRDPEYGWPILAPPGPCSVLASLQVMARLVFAVGVVLHHSLGRDLPNTP